MVIAIVSKLEELAKQHKVLLDYIDKKAKLAEVLNNPNIPILQPLQNPKRVCSYSYL